MAQQSGQRKARRRDILKTTGGSLAAGLSVGLAGCTSGDQDATATEEPADGGGDSTPTQSQYANYPQRTIVWVNPSGPSGGFGSSGFALKEVLPEYLPNENADIAIEAVGNWPRGTQRIHNAEPDGFTIGFGNVPGVIVNQVLGDWDYDLSEWSWIVRYQKASYTVYVTPDSKFETIQDLINTDETIRIGRFGGTGTIVNLLTFSTLGIDFETVPGLEGGGDAYAALLRGDLDVLAYSDGSTLPVRGIDDGEIRPLMTLWEEIPQHLVEDGFDDVPTAKELGYDSLSGFGLNRLIGAPPGLDQELQDILTDAFLGALEDEEFQSWAEENNFPIHPGGQDAALSAVEQSIQIIEEKRDFLSQYYG